MAAEALRLADVVQTVQEYRQQLLPEGLRLVGIFGSYATGDFDRYSDIDIAYELDMVQFSKRYHDGFSKILRIEEIKKSLEAKLHKKVDLISLDSANRTFREAIAEEMIYV